jgi:hypothetical protein
MLISFLFTTLMSLSSRLDLNDVLRCLARQEVFKYTETPDKFFELLKVCAEHMRQSQNINSIVTWIVNYHLPLLIETALKFDPLIFNKLFAPDDGE